MKKIIEYRPMYLSPVKMHWDDLVEICDIINKDRIITIKSGEYSYETLSELKENTQKNYINHIEIEGRGQNYNNRLSVEICADKVIIYQNADSSEAACKLKETLNCFSHWYMYNPKSLIWGTIGTIPGGMLLPFSVYIAKNNSSLGFLFLFTGILISTWSFRTNPIFGGSKIYTFLKKDKITFFERNKDLLFQNIVVAIITIIITTFINILIKQ